MSASDLIANAERLFGVKATRFVPLKPLSNGILVDFYQNLAVISLIDAQYEWQRGRFLKIRKGDKCLVRQTSPGILSLGKQTAAWNFRDVKEDVYESVDFRVIDGEVPYPPKQTQDIAAISDADIDTSNIPEGDASFFACAKRRLLP